MMGWGIASVSPVTFISLCAAICLSMSDSESAGGTPIEDRQWASEALNGVSLGVFGSFQTII